VNKAEQKAKEAIVREIYKELEEYDVLEDRREYSRDDLKGAYPFLSPDQVNYLYDLIQDNFRREVHIYPLFAYSPDQDHTFSGKWLVTSPGPSHPDKVIFNSLEAARGYAIHLIDVNITEHIAYLPEELS